MQGYLTTQAASFANRSAKPSLQSAMLRPQSTRSRKTASIMDVEMGVSAPTARPTRVRSSWQRLGDRLHRPLGGIDILMLLENNPYPQDARVRAEAQSLAAMGYKVQVIAPRATGQRRRERLAGVDVRRFHTVDANGMGATGFLREYLVAAAALHIAALRGLVQGARALHIHNPPDIFFPAGALFRLAGRKVVFDHHDLFPETVEAKVKGALLAALARAGERLTYAVANHVVATNESYADVARSRGDKGPEDVTIVRNAPPVHWMCRRAAVRPGTLASVHLAYLGAVSTQDGVDGLLPVLSLLRARRLEVTLTVVGDGDARRAFEDELRRRDLHDRVRVTGWVASDDVPATLHAADICVDPAPATDVNNRSTMTKIAEYLALGKPVVAYDLLETRRTTGDAALLVPPGDVERFVGAIAELAKDEVLRDRLSRSARQRAVVAEHPGLQSVLGCAPSQWGCYQFRGCCASTQKRWRTVSMVCLAHCARTFTKWGRRCNRRVGPSGLRERPALQEQERLGAQAREVQRPTCKLGLSRCREHTQGRRVLRIPVHAAVCAATDLPLAWTTESANHAEQTFALGPIDAARGRGFGIRTAIMDSGCDSEPIHDGCMDRGHPADYSVARASCCRARRPQAAGLPSRRLELRESRLQAPRDEVALPDG